MTVSDRCRNIREQTGQLDARRRADKEAQSFRARTTELQPIRIELVAELERLGVLQRKGIAIVKPPLPSGALKVLGDCETSIAAHPTESGRDFGRLKRAVEKVVDELRAAANKALDAVARDLPTIEESFLKQVELIPSRKEQVAKIREKRDALFRGKAVDLRSKTAEDLELFLGKRDELSVLAEELSPEEFPKEVLDFFKAARQGGAPLDKLTDTVREWLAARDQLKDLRITVASR